MKTFLMIYDNKRKSLIDEYEDENDPNATFGNWVFEVYNEFTFEDLKEQTIFYFIGSDVQNEREAGVIKYNIEKDKMEFKKLPLYFLLSFEIRNSLYEKNRNIKWNDKENQYIMWMEEGDELDEDDLLEFSIPLDVIIPQQEYFLRSRLKFHRFVTLRGRKYLRKVGQDLRLTSFYKKCNGCKADIELNISNMIQGEVICPFCTKINKSKNKTTIH
jgi:hypothetical protein